MQIKCIEFNHLFQLSLFSEPIYNLICLGDDYYNRLCQYIFLSDFGLYLSLQYNLISDSSFQNYHLSNLDFICMSIVLVSTRGYYDCLLSIQI